jgi:hypothetical protein
MMREHSKPNANAPSIPMTGASLLQEWWALSVGFTDTTQFASLTNKTGSLFTEMMLAGEKPSYKIHVIVGDADAGRGMEFGKK